MKRVLISVVVLAAIAYTIDCAAFRLRPDPTGVITVKRSYIIPLKNGHTEYTSQETIDQPCARSLLPHQGNTPCWYLVRHTQQEITIDTGSQKQYPH